jgi:hypothetical protein
MFDVRSQRNEAVNVVVQQAQGCVAWVAEDTANTAGDMVVVDVNESCVVGFVATNLTASSQHQDHLVTSETKRLHPHPNSDARCAP